MNMVSEVVNLAGDIIRLNACSHQITGADIKSEKASPPGAKIFRTGM
jgi:hypothetical protein